MLIYSVQVSWFLIDILCRYCICYWIWGQFSSVAQSYETLCDPMDCSTPSFPVHHQLLELAQTHIHRVSDGIQPSHPLSPPCPPAFNLFQHQVFSNESALRIRWPKYWSFSFNVDYDGYSISSKGSLPTVVDIMVIWVNSPIPVHSLSPRMSTFTLAISCWQLPSCLNSWT